jgi:hypothetical protein
MLWTYQQSTGALLRDGVFVANGYSGFGDGKNNPDKQEEKGIGPIPVGKYRVGTPFDSPHTSPFAMRLTPLDGTEMFGRTDLEMHGDSIAKPGTASHGCVIFPRYIREMVWKSRESGDITLKVVP